MKNLNWKQSNTIPSRSYTCGYCGNPLASNQGYSAYLDGNSQNSHHGVIMICHKCSRPTFFDHDGRQSPGVTFGNDVDGIDDEKVEALYREARKSTGAGCYTLSVLACRKLLMHIAVSKGADQGKNFVYYVEYLSDKNYSRLNLE